MPLATATYLWSVQNFNQSIKCHLPLLQQLLLLQPRQRRNRVIKSGVCFSSLRIESYQIGGIFTKFLLIWKLPFDNTFWSISKIWFFTCWTNSFESNTIMNQIRIDYQTLHYLGLTFHIQNAELISSSRTRTCESQLSQIHFKLMAVDCLLITDKYFLL